MTVYADFEKGQSYFGFELKEKKFVQEVNATCLLFEHTQSGARLLKIAADDDNKTFSIAFKTVPESDAGTPHIMEHSVLNGSKNFPVKSPFDVLAKGSLNTFLNAMTGSDITIYPVASMNDKDYFNLMHVYLDAVFNPLIYDDPRILKQEGWHHELTDAEAPIVYKGVVYNEMKGAYSNPVRELEYQVGRHLFPDNAYRFSSGGYPKAIPSLSLEAFLDYHRKYYHPSNSYIFLYGDADLSAELEFIDREYLSSYQRSDAKVSLPLQQPFAAMKKATAFYPVAAEADTVEQTYLAVSYVCGTNIEQKLTTALDILADVLVNQESGPVRIALQKQGIGKDVRAMVDPMQQNVFQIYVQNANPHESDRFLGVIRETLTQLVSDGLDKQAAEGTLNRLEFRLREGDDAQKGLTYNFRALNGWFFADDPFLSLEWEKPLAAIKKEMQEGYLEKVIQDYLLDNQHALLLTMKPKPGLEALLNDEVSQELGAFKASLSPEEIGRLVEETRELLDYQQREDDPTALATIPMLDLRDINP
ncbi:peptidase, partial [candidate division KSB1 bacterium]